MLAIKCPTMYLPREKLDLSESHQFGFEFTGFMFAKVTHTHTCDQTKSQQTDQKLYHFDFAREACTHVAFMPPLRENCALPFWFCSMKVLQAGGKWIIMDSFFWPQTDIEVRKIIHIYI